MFLQCRIKLRAASSASMSIFASYAAAMGGGTFMGRAEEKCRSRQEAPTQ